MNLAISAVSITGKIKSDVYRIRFIHRLGSHRTFSFFSRLNGFFRVLGEHLLMIRPALLQVDAREAGLLMISELDHWGWFLIR